MLATRLEPTRQSFEFYDSVARECGYEAGTQHRGYLFKVHVDETEELAWQTPTPVGGVVAAKRPAKAH